MKVELMHEVPPIPFNISLQNLVRRFKEQVSVTWILVLVEGLLYLFLPLLIGGAISGLLKQSYQEVYFLIALCVGMLVTGAARRFYDTRAYGKIFRNVSMELVEKERKRQSPTSSISARSHLFQEFIEFLEHSIPEISHNFINLFGTLAIIVALNFNIFLVCLLSGVVAILIYSISGSRIYRLNKGENDEFEQQVNYLDTGNREQLHAHFSRLMRWKIRLSDLETINFTGVWLGLSTALVASIILITNPDKTDIGSAVSVIMYVFGFIQSAVAFPLYYQQLVRLREIEVRLR